MLSKEVRKQLADLSDRLSACLFLLSCLTKMSVESIIVVTGNCAFCPRKIFLCYNTHLQSPFDLASSVDLISITEKID